MTPTLTDAEALAVLRETANRDEEYGWKLSARRISDAIDHFAALVAEREALRKREEWSKGRISDLEQAALHQCARAESAEAKVAELHLLRCERDEKQACIEVSAARIADLESRLAASEADARRFAFIIETPGQFSCWKCSCGVTVHMQGMGSFHGADIRDAIDSALSTAATKGGGS